MSDVNDKIITLEPDDNNISSGGDENDDSSDSNSDLKGNADKEDKTDEELALSLIHI